MPNARCLCGQITIETHGSPDRILNCHCQSCRRHTGAPMATLAVFHPDQVIFAGPERSKFVSAPGVERGFCPSCGTTLTWETTLGDEPICAVHISNFKDPNVFAPQGHSFYGEKLIWHDTVDNLPRFAGFVKDAQPIQIGPRKTE